MQRYPVLVRFIVVSGMYRLHGRLRRLSQYVCERYKQRRVGGEQQICP